MVACPRNQLYLEHEVAGFWRSLAVSGRAQHSSQIALQSDLQATAGGLEHDRFDQSSNGVGCTRTALCVLQGVTEAGDLLPIDIGHLRMQQLRHLWCLEVSLQLGLSGFERQ